MESPEAFDHATNTCGCLPCHRQPHHDTSKWTSESTRIREDATVLARYTSQSRPTLERKYSCLTAHTSNEALPGRTTAHKCNHRSIKERICAGHSHITAENYPSLRTRSRQRYQIISLDYISQFNRGMLRRGAPLLYNHDVVSMLEECRRQTGNNT